MRRLVLFVLLIVSMCAKSQVATGIYSFGSFDNRGFDSINLGNLNAHFSIPIFAKTGRGGSNFRYNLVYDSSVWTPVNLGSSYAWQPSATWGWTVDTNVVTGYFTYTSTTRKCFADPSGWTWSTIASNFTYVDPLGGTHNFPGTTSDCSSYGPESMDIRATDGSGYYLEAGYAAFVIQDPSGKTISPPINTASGVGNATDTNGNQISTSSSGIVDTTGTTVISYGTISGGRTLTYPVWESATSSITTGTAAINYGTYNIQTAFGCSIGGSGVSEYSATSVSLPQSIVLQDGQTYSFEYEATPGASGYYTGRLKKITLPTGGVITYNYSGANTIVCSDGGASVLTRTESSSAGTPTWTYTRTPGTTEATTSTAVTDGLGNPSTYNFVADTADDPQLHFYETSRMTYQGSGTTALLSMQSCYNYQPPPCTTQSIALPITELVQYRTLDGSQTAATTISYNSAGLVTEEDDYDFSTSSTGGSLLQKTTTSYASLSSNKINAPSLIQVYDGLNRLIASTTYGYDETSPVSTSSLPQHVVESTQRGNLTSISQYNESPQVSLVSHTTYDDAGQALTSTDPNGNQTTYSYDSATDTFLTQVTMPTTGGVGHQASATWDVASGAAKSTVDQNGNTTSYSYDSMDRLASISYPDGGSSSLMYSLASGSPHTSVSVLHAGSSWITYTSYLDPYARTKQTDQTDIPHDDLVDYAYDGNGNLSSVSNPYRTGDTPIYSVTAFDALGRAHSLTETDGSVVSDTYSGNTVTHADEASHKREIVTDGLGRIAAVLEPDSNNNLTLETDYLYNQNWNYSSSSGVSYQTIVNQKGGSSSSSDWRTRTFTYDQLGRIIGESTPEAGTTSLNYWGASYSAFCSGDPTLPCSRTDANSTTINYSYDALNRLTGKTYGGSSIGTATPAVTYAYDQSSYNGLTIANRIGQRTGMSDGSGATAWSFDSMGRIGAIRKTVNSVTKQANFTYNADGSQNTIQDFGGTTLTYGYNSAAFPTGLTDGAGNTYAASAAYNAAGQLTGVNHQLTSGAGNYVRSWQYNTRMQPSVISATLNGNTIQSLQYGYGSAGTDNGNVRTIVNGMDAVRNQTYNYDNMNRLSSAWDSGHWGETYYIDNWGNLYQTLRRAGYTYGNNWSVSANTHNQLSNLAYDAAGEVTQDQYGNLYTYDAEGRILAGGSGSYVYDGDGNRVKKTASSATTLYWPGAGRILDESDSTGATMAKQVQFAGRLVWSESVASGGRFLFQDHLGSTRITGTSPGSLKDDLDYLPFGSVENNYGPSPSDNHYTFTGYESDQSESSTDYAVYRSLGTTMGRFNRPDPYDGSYNQSNPQTLNRYSYVLNNPLNNTDPTGLECVWDDGSYDSNDDSSTGAGAVDGSGNHTGCSGQGGTWIDHSYFTSNNMADWSSQGNSTLADMIVPSATVTFNYDASWAAAYLTNWAAGRLPLTMQYGQNDPATLAMVNRPYVQAQLAAYKAAGCPASGPATNAGQESIPAYQETRADFASGNPNYVQAEVGGYTGNFTTSGGVTTITLTNVSSISSLSGYSAGVGEINKGLGTNFSRNSLDRTSGAGRNVTQTFTQTMPSPCGGG